MEEKVNSYKKYFSYILSINIQGKQFKGKHTN